MDEDIRLTRRSLLQLIITVISAVSFAARRPLVASPAADDVAAEGARAGVHAGEATSLDESSLLDTFLRRHRIRPAHLSRASGYSRTFLLGLRRGHVHPAPWCIAAIVCACRQLTGLGVRPDELFARAVIDHAFRAFPLRDLAPEQVEELEAAFGRRVRRRRA